MKSWTIADGILKQQEGYVLFVDLQGRSIAFSGIRVHVGCFFIPRQTAFQFLGHIFISRHWLDSGFNLLYFSHEYGHYLQQCSLGVLRYIFGIAIPSVWSMLVNPIKHPTKRFERHATLLGERYVRNNISVTHTTAVKNKNLA